MFVGGSVGWVNPEDYDAAVERANAYSRRWSKLQTGRKVLERVTTRNALHLSPKPAQIKRYLFHKGRGRDEGSIAIREGWTVSFVRQCEEMAKNQPQPK